MSFFRKACMYTMNLYNFQENLFLFSRNFTIWIGLQLASQSDSFQALGSCFCEKYSISIVIAKTTARKYSPRTLRQLSAIPFRAAAVFVRSIAPAQVDNGAA